MLIKFVSNKTKSKLSRNVITMDVEVPDFSDGKINSLNLASSYLNN